MIMKIFYDTAFTKQNINIQGAPFIQLYCDQTKQG